MAYNQIDALRQQYYLARLMSSLDSQEVAVEEERLKRITTHT